MQNGNGSSYKAIIYILLVALSFLAMHINLKINYYYHRQQIKSIQFSDSTNAQQTSPALQDDFKSFEEEPLDKKEPVDSSAVASEESLPVMDTTAMTTLKLGDKEYFEQLLDSIRTGDDPRKDVVIRYYKKDKDGDKVYKLRDLGYYIHERPAEGDLDHFGSNAIFYGDAITREDLAIIAYFLIDSGVDLQNISLSKFHDTWKAHSVEIGTDTTVLNQPNLTLSDLRKSWRDF